MRKLLYSTLISLALFTLYSQDTNLYEKGRTEYRSGAYADAAATLEAFRAAEPGSNKVDDALWYLGRVYRALGRITEAVAAFETVIADEGSNRATEALYDLMRLFDGEDREAEAIGFTREILAGDPTDEEVNKALKILLKSYFLHGLRTRGDGLGREAIGLWRDGIAVTDEALGDGRPDTVQAEILGYRIKFEIRLAQTVGDPVERGAAIEGAQAALLMLEGIAASDPEERAEFATDIAAVVTDDGDFDYSLFTAAGYNGLLAEAGVLAELDLAGSIPIGFLTFLEWDIGYQHDPFSLKTFNFPADETGDERMIRTTNEFSGGLALSWGSKYLFRQKFGLNGTVRLAEDDGDYHYGGDLEYDFDYSLNNAAVIGLDSSLALSIYPDYANDTRKIDNYKLTLSPYYRRILGNDHYLEFDYAVYWKNYLDARYDTAAGGIDPDNRSYLSNALAVEWGRDFTGGISLALGGESEYLKSFNYDLIVPGVPADRFIEDYYDYVRNTLSVEIVYRDDLIRSSLDGSAGLRTFLNYEARDENQVFMNEKRIDTSFDIFWENRLVLMEDEIWGRLSFAFDAYLNRAISNHGYEAFYEVDYTDWGVMIGFEWED